MNEGRAHFLMVGDRADIPRIRATVRRLPVDAYGQVFIEVASALQTEKIDAPQGMTVTWLRRDRAQGELDRVIAPGDLAARVVRAWVSEWIPEENGAEPYVLWIGCAESVGVDRLYWDLRARIPHLHLHHPHDEG